MKYKGFMVNSNITNIVYAENIAGAENQIKKKNPQLVIMSIEEIGSKENIHELKIVPEEFSNVCLRLKKAEFRKNDRDFRVNDIIKLKEWVQDGEYYTGNTAMLLITHIQTGFGIPEGYCVISNEMINHNRIEPTEESRTLS